MATQAEMRKKSKRKRTFKEKTLGLVQLSKTILVTMISFLIVLTAIVYICNCIWKDEGIKILKNEGLYCPIELANGDSINLSVYGNQAGSHTVVPISGIGVESMSVYMQHITAKLSNDLCVALVDRAGHGISNDSKQTQTIDTIVNNYREALKRAGLNGPYILVAHEFGGVYATYWSNKYPEDIEAIVFIDGTVIVSGEPVQFAKPSAVDQLFSIACKLGFQRIMRTQVYDHISKAFTKEEAECERALNSNNIYSTACLSELKLREDNYNEALAIMEVNEIPKLYISATGAFTTRDEIEEYLNYKNEQSQELGYPLFFSGMEDENALAQKVKQMLAESASLSTQVDLFLTNSGNCTLTKVPGDIRIYEQKPIAIEAALRDYIQFIQDGSVEMKPYYDNPKMIDWGDHQELIDSPTQVN